MAQVSKPGICTRRCNSCAYSFHDGLESITTTTYCGYLVRTGKPRPCPAGQGCTEYKPKRRKKK